MSAKWLKETVFPNLVRLMKSAEENRGKKPHVSTIDIEQYSKTYQRIKLSIGKSIVESWTEKTDPHKFVYEDCALTAYLKVLFRETDSMPKKFVDVGCGNGLLVKLLKEEGITGVGVDIRKRNIWDEFIAQGVQLCEASLDPQTASGMPEGADYLIGNHSDELTPWIPIMAAKTHPGTTHDLDWLVSVVVVLDSEVISVIGRLFVSASFGNISVGWSSSSVHAM
ncbi:hypothetical protein L596_023583 [Steinernema carpocapsae]|uniref:tRNA (uracil-O(2)-)-methyltransferase n=1 Tax=Steinernema carpocapsae TaxID=34508 RepID=A0A4U5ME33_STECR|nr:hypothetical protein L596_023583 [Steinernema carpocapsae]